MCVHVHIHLFILFFSLSGYHLSKSTANMQIALVKRQTKITHRFLIS